MKLLIISTAPLIYKDNKVFAYGPYTNELIVYKKYIEKISFACPVWTSDKELLVSEIPFSIENHFKLIDSNLNSFTNIFKSFFQSIYNLMILFKAIKDADHVHLRCPGNIGLIGSFAQIFFPSKIKTAKYAGNWDPKSNQPWTYKLQKYILSNTFLTKNIQVLVYGEWPGQSKNIKSFFTATYYESEKKIVSKPALSTFINFIFTGSLVKGKNPLYALRLVNELIKSGNNIVLNMYGEGIERKILEDYITTNSLEQNVFLHGNQKKEILKLAYEKSHFVILPSKSEGWPKTIAEGMFLGCVPVATKISCVPFMLDYGKRGILLEMDLEKDRIQIQNLLSNPNDFLIKSELAQNWSQKYTMEVFETEIKNLLKK